MFTNRDKPMTKSVKWFILFVCMTLPLLVSSQPGGQQPAISMYNVSAEDIYPYVLGTVGLYLGGQVIRHNSDGPEIEDLNLLRVEDIWAFDRGAAMQYSPGIAQFSDYLLYGSFALPMISYLDRSVRKEGAAMAVMLLEAVLITDGITNMIKGSTKRYRPYNYNPEIPLTDKLSGGSRLSFVSGHTSITAAMTFLSARVLSDLHPHSKARPWIWGAAAVIPAITGYCRFRAGKHFPSDIIGGYALGMGMGLLVPRLHRSPKFTLGPTAHGVGVTMVLR